MMLPGLAADGDSPMPLRVRFTPGSIVRAVVVVMVFIIVVQVIGAAAEPIVWFLEGVVGAAIFYPIVVVLGRKMPHWVAVALVSLLLVVFVGLVGLRMFTELKGEAEQFQANAPTIANNIESSSAVGDAAKQFGLGEKIEKVSNDIGSAFSFSESSVSTLSTAASIGSSLFVIWLFGVMMLFSAPAFLGGAGRQIQDEQRRERMGVVLATAYLNAWKYLAVSAVRSLGYGLTTFVVAWSTDLQAPTLLSVFVAVFAFVPGVGLILGGVLVSLVAMFSSFSLAGVLMIGYIVVQVVDVRFIQRPINRETVHVGPALTAIAAIIGFGLYGMGGAILACALLFFVLAILDQLRPDPDQPPDLEGDADVDLETVTAVLQPNSSE